MMQLTPQPKGEILTKTSVPALLAVLLLLVVSLPATVRADSPGPHPRYLHALSDLRLARAHVERRSGDPQVNWDEQVAIKEIDAAIREIKAAAIDDGKAITDHPPVDAHGAWHGRLHRALELLRTARKDIDEGESNDFAHGLRNRALHHVDSAIAMVEKGLADAAH
jgi:hypothetical protein